MKIGVPREIKVKESRVACTPGGIRMYLNAGHDVLVEKGAGMGSAVPGCSILDSSPYKSLIRMMPVLRTW